MANAACFELINTSRGIGELIGKHVLCVREPVLSSHLATQLGLISWEIYYLTQSPNVNCVET